VSKRDISNRSRARAQAAGPSRTRTKDQFFKHGRGAILPVDGFVSFSRGATGARRGYRLAPAKLVRSLITRAFVIDIPIKINRPRANPRAEAPIYDRPSPRASFAQRNKTDRRRGMPRNRHAMHRTRSGAATASAIRNPNPRGEMRGIRSLPGIDRLRNSNRYSLGMINYGER